MTVADRDYGEFLGQFVEQCSRPRARVDPGDIVYYDPLGSITIIYEPTVLVPTLTKMVELLS